MKYVLLFLAGLVAGALAMRYIDRPTVAQITLQHSNDSARTVARASDTLRAAVRVALDSARAGTVRAVVSAQHQAASSGEVAARQLDSLVDSLPACGVLKPVWEAHLRDDSVAVGVTMAALHQDSVQLAVAWAWSETLASQRDAALRRVDQALALPHGHGLKTDAVIVLATISVVKIVEAIVRR